MKDTVVRRVIDVSNAAQAAYDKNVGNTSQPEPILGNNFDSVNIAAHENDYPLLTTDATLSAVSTIRSSVGTTKALLPQLNRTCINLTKSIERHALLISSDEKEESESICSS